MTHTPGPWRESDARPDGIESANRGEFAGEIWGPDIKGRSEPIAMTYYCSETESEANARLIAAAPDLLAALQEWTSMAVNSGLEGCDEILEQAEAAIALAEEDVTQNPGETKTPPATMQSWFGKWAEEMR
jgi:hypothetical protein